MSWKYWVLMVMGKQKILGWKSALQLDKIDSLIYIGWHAVIKLFNLTCLTWLV